MWPILERSMEKISKKSLITFGLIWAFIFFMIAVSPTFSGKSLRVIPAYISAAFVVISLTFPQIYTITKFYEGWTKFGGFIGKINSKIIIFVLFYAIFCPVGLVLKLLGKDLLGKRFDRKSKESYFVDRTEQPTNMENQF